jgi:hypothetical protein
VASPLLLAKLPPPSMVPGAAKMPYSPL